MRVRISPRARTPGNAAAVGAVGRQPGFESWPQRENGSRGSTAGTLGYPPVPALAVAHGL